MNLSDPSLFIDTGDTTNIFALGANVNVVPQDKKKAIEQKGEDRMADTLAIKDGQNNAKRDRDNYAVTLRKQKR